MNKRYKMRNKFTELIEQGIARFDYTPIAPEIPEQDPICRMYNNIFSIPSDTHMACSEELDCRIITGHLIANKEKWGEFTCSSNWGAINFMSTGFWCLNDFLFKHGLDIEVTSLNGDIVALVKPRSIDSDKTMAPNQVVTNESNVPQPITVITNSGNMMHVAECFGGTKDETIKKLNESSFIKGSQWAPSENGIIGLVAGKVYSINL